MPDVYRQRLKLLREQCQKYETKSASTSFNLKADETYSYFYCFIPKVSNGFVFAYRVVQK